MSRAASSIPTLFAVFLLTAACGEQEAPHPLRLASRQVYREAGTSSDPHLVMVRDLLAVGDLLYVLDGRLAHVVVMDPGGRVVRRFGRPGEGPEELGRFPWGLVTDGERVGVASLFHVSWFTPEGRFLERERLPAADLMNPSIQYSDGWVVNLPFQGQGGAIALYAPAGGDTLRMGSASMPREGGLRSPAASEWNAVQVVRFDPGSLLLAYQQKNLIQVLSPEGRVVRVHRWEHLSEERPRRQDGTLEGMPGYTLSARCWDGRTAVLVDGSGRRVLEIDHEGRIQGSYLLREGAAWAGRSSDGRLFAAGGSDRVVELVRQSPDSAAGPRGSEAHIVSTIPMQNLLPDPETSLRAHGVYREPAYRRDAPPQVIGIALGDTSLFLGYGDGLGVLLDHRDSLSFRAALQPVTGSRLTSVHVTGREVFAADCEQGITPLRPRGPQIPLPGSMRYRGLVPSSPDRWFAVARAKSWGLYLWEPARGGLTRLAGLEGRAGAAVEVIPLDRGRAALVDRDRLELAVCTPGEGLTWRPIRGTGFRKARRSLFGTPEADLEGVARFGIGEDLLLWSSRLDGGSAESWIERLGLDGEVRGRWRVPLRWRLRDVAGREGAVYLLSRSGLYLWRPQAP